MPYMHPFLSTLHGGRVNSYDPMDCSPPGSYVHGIFQARVLEWGAIAFSAQCIRVPLSSALSTFVIFFFLSGHPDSYEVVSNCDFDLHFPSA